MRVKKEVELRSYGATESELLEEVEVKGGPRIKGESRSSLLKGRGGCCVWFHAFCSVLFCSVPFRSALFCSALLCSVLICSVLLCSVLFYSAQFRSVLFLFLTCARALQATGWFTRINVTRVFLRSLKQIVSIVSSM
ncbi:hypothetical protein M0802_008037 [Mischocyttarus mexicanus]|nr:hypothetical protein M0802_008037 [Mischocyttarus mexicanus]